MKKTAKMVMMMATVVCAMFSTMRVNAAPLVSSQVEVDSKQEKIQDIIVEVVHYTQIIPPVFDENGLIVQNWSTRKSVT